MAPCDIVGGDGHVTTVQVGSGDQVLDAVHTVALDPTMTYPVLHL